MSKRKKVWECAVEILKETDNPAVMWGDATLLHLIAERAGMPAESWETEQRVLNALSKTPGIFIKRRTEIHGRIVRIFRLPGTIGT